MISRIASIISLALVCSAPALASDLMLSVEHARVVRLPDDAAAVVVGNPSIADAMVHDRRTLVLTGRLQGRTNVIAMDRIGRIIYSQEIAVTNPVAGQVALFRGGDRTTLSCTDTCDEVPRVGDNTARVEWLNDQQTDRLGIVETATADDSGDN